MPDRDPNKLYPHDHVLAWTVLPLIPSSVSPNMITVLRFVLTPGVLFLLYVQNWTWGIPAFLLTAFTDAIDGSLARVRHQVTAWGTFFDPVADKLLIGSIVMLMVAEYVGSSFALLILACELLVALGAYRRHRRKGIASANIFGKIKMMVQVIGVTILLVAAGTNNLLLIPWSVGFFSIALALALASFFTYSL